MLFVSGKVSKNAQNKVKPEVLKIKIICYNCFSSLSCILKNRELPKHILLSYQKYCNVNTRNMS